MATLKKIEKENPTKLVINESMFYLFGGYYEPFKVSLLIGEWSCTSWFIGAHNRPVTGGPKSQPVYWDETGLFSWLNQVLLPIFMKYTEIGMDQNLLNQIWGGWTSICQLFWCSPESQCFEPQINSRLKHVSAEPPSANNRWDMTCEGDALQPGWVNSVTTSESRVWFV
jgi:hypothetical protein